MNIENSIEVSELPVDEEIILVEEQLHDTPLDPRLGGLSEEARRVIDAYYGGSVDEAVYAAARLVGNFARPPEWALEVHGKWRRGWRDYNRTRV